MEFLLEEFIKETKNNCSDKKTIIVVGNTVQQFKKKELVFFNGVDTFVVYYLINENNQDIYFNDQRVFWFSID